jgi:hypothetical protein
VKPKLIKNETAKIIQKSPPQPTDTPPPNTNTIEVETVSEEEDSANEKAPHTYKELPSTPVTSNTTVQPDLPPPKTPRMFIPTPKYVKGNTNLTHDHSDSQQEESEGEPSRLTVRKIYQQEIQIPLPQENTKYYPKKKIRDAQSDPGANISATNRRDIIWNYQEYKEDVQVATFNNPCKAYGEGIIKIITEENDVIDHTILYMPDATGTVISPDKLVIDNARIYDEFVHIG